MKITAENVIEIFEDEFARLLRKKKQDDKRKKARQTLYEVEYGMLLATEKQTLGLN